MSTFEVIKDREKSIIKIPTDTYDQLMAITRQTLYEYPWGHIQAMVYGKKRIGKSIYLIKSMMEQYRIVYNYDVDTAFNEVMKHTFFTIREFIDVIKELDRNKEYIVSCHIDDAACGFSSLTWFEKGGRKLVKELRKTMDTLGNRVIGLYLSSPARTGIINFISEYEAKIIKITSNRRQGNPWDRVAKLYSYRVLPSGTTRISSRIDKDPFSCHLNNKYFSVYNAIRNTYSSDNIDKLDEAEKNISQLDISHNFSKKILGILEQRLDASNL